MTNRTVHMATTRLLSSTVRTTRSATEGDATVKTMTLTRTTFSRPTRSKGREPQVILAQTAATSPQTLTIATASLTKTMLRRTMPITAVTLRSLKTTSTSINTSHSKCKTSVHSRCSKEQQLASRGLAGHSGRRATNRSWIGSWLSTTRFTRRTGTTISTTSREASLLKSWARLLATLHCQQQPRTMTALPSPLSRRRA